MKFNDLKIISIEIVMILFLVLTLFVSSIQLGNITTAVILCGYAILICLLFKRKKTKSLFSKETTVSMIVLAVVYLILFYFIGVFISFTKSIYPLRWDNFLHIIVPFALIVISSEVIRSKLLNEHVYIRLFKKKKIDLSLIFTFIMMVCIDLVLYARVYNLTNQDDFLAAIGYILFASISTNLLFNYLTIRFDSKCVIAYRLITVLYMYVIPIIPDVYIYFKSFARMIYPYIIYLYMENTYAKTSFVVAFKDKSKSIISTTSMIVFSTILIMLISCKFYFCLIVIGTGSMTGTINMGDMILYKDYRGDELEVDDIIVFREDNKDVIHRIIDIKRIDGENRYYTKGDYNENKDSGYRTDDLVEGIYLFRIPYIGWPNIWFRRLFN